MDRRLILAIGLMLIVAVLPSILFPPRRPPIPPPEQDLPDSAAVTAFDSVSDTAVPQQAVEARPPIPQPAPPVTDTSAAVTSADSVVVESSLYRYVFSTRGARLIAATLKSYESFGPGESGPVQLIPETSHFFEHSLVLGSDTVSLADWSFEPSRTQVSVQDEGASLEWVAANGSATVRLTQTFSADQYRWSVDGQFSGTSTGTGLILVQLGPRLRLVEADSVWDFRSYAVVTKGRSVEGTNFNKLGQGERVALEGPFDWVAMKSRYFVTAVLTVEEAEPRIGGAVARGGIKVDRYEKEADLLLSLPAPGGGFSYTVYLGPQELRYLSRMGHNLKDMNPYGWFLRPIIQPIANVVARVLVWMHQTLRLEYGWVLVLFGVAVRIVMWPLNQKAMHSSMAMQAIQPEIKAVQERYKQDPQRLQQEMMKLYKEHGVNPLGGCLPLLLPMPVLFALFFVFRETIEFRGVPFLWIPDLSRADPLYIIPVLMGLSMFVVSKLGQRGIPPSPQAKLMVYFMPVMLTVLFFKFSAGLNLYYAVSNIASIPQQWMISEKRLKRTEKKPA
ncbi:MAG: membrane protein insertase YidC [Gemmatimonadota bacterium]|nr:MAG: membrane protein insertase YidC [Gemmatimonadota bacterium]